MLQQLAESIKRERLQIGLSQSQLANKTGLSKSTISKVESGNVDPTLGTISKIMKALGYNTFCIELN